MVRIRDRDRNVVPGVDAMQRDRRSTAPRVSSFVPGIHGII